MIYYIYISTYTLPAYQVIHPIVVKAHVIKRRYALVTYHGTIKTSKGPELYNKLITALQEAGIYHKYYEIKIDPPLSPEGSKQPGPDASSEQRRATPNS